MRLHRYGIHLRSMQPEDLEMVRQWRNAPHVQENMEFREEISPEMQRAWFEGLDPQRNVYLIAESRGVPFAVVHVKDIDWEELSGEAGVFVGDRSQLGSFEPVLAVLAMMDIVFFVFGLQCLRAKVKADHPPILDFNRRLGYIPLPGQEGEAFIRLEVSPEAYLSTARPLRKLAFRYDTGTSWEVDEPVFRERLSRSVRDLGHLSHPPD